jgi:hypothetical protein
VRINPRIRCKESSTTILPSLFRVRSPNSSRRTSNRTKARRLLQNDDPYPLETTRNFEQSHLRSLHSCTTLLPRSTLRRLLRPRYLRFLLSNLLHLSNHSIDPKLSPSLRVTVLLRIILFRLSLPLLPSTLTRLRLCISTGLANSNNTLDPTLLPMVSHPDRAFHLSYLNLLLLLILIIIILILILISISLQLLLLPVLRLVEVTHRLPLPPCLLRISTLDLYLPRRYLNRSLTESRIPL